MSTASPGDGTYDLTWNVPSDPVTTPPTTDAKAVSYEVKNGKIHTPWGVLTWDTEEAIFAHGTLPIGLRCTGEHTFVGTNGGTTPPTEIEGACTKR